MLLKKSLLLGRRAVTRELMARRLAGPLRMRIDTLWIRLRYGLRRVFSR